MIHVIIFINIKMNCRPLWPDWPTSTSYIVKYTL